MTHPKQPTGEPLDEPLQDDDQPDLPDEVRESLEDTAREDWGDETQSNEERTAEEGMEQDRFIDPRGEDDAGDAADVDE